MHEWPVLRVRHSDVGSVAKGPVHCVFGNGTLAAQGLPSDPYAEWQWDGTRLVARTDRYGFFPLFYATTATEIVLSPSLVAVVDTELVPATLNDTALAVLLRMGFLVGDDTPFEHVHLLPPHGELIWEQGRLSVTGKLEIAAVYSSTRAAAIDEYIDRFREAVRRRPAVSMAVVPLSGGRDSRHIFLELCAQNRPPALAVTVAPSPTTSDAEIDVAGALARQAGVRHVTLTQPSDRWGTEMVNTLETHFSTFEHWWLQPLVRYLKGQDATVYEGVGGDVLSTLTLFRTSPAQQRLYAEGNLEKLADTLLGGEGYLPRVLPSEQYRRSNRDVAVARVVRELARHVDAPRPLASFLLYNRSRRVTGLPPASLLGAVSTVWCPYLDADLFDFLSALPPDVMAGADTHDFHDAAVARAYPQYAGVPYAVKAAHRRSAPWYEWRLSVAMGEAWLRHTPWLVRPSFLYPRLVRTLVDPGYRPEIITFVALTSYLLQLSRHAKARPS